MSDEVKGLIDGVKSAFEQFKSTNDERLKALEAGKNTSDFDEKLAKIDADLDKLQGEITKAQRLPQPGADGRQRTAEEVEHAKGFNLFVRKGHDANLRELEQKAMSVGSDPDGGYLVTPDMSGRIVKKVFDTSPIRQLAAVQTISTDALEGFSDRDEASYGWAGETSTRSETDTPDLGKYRIEVHEMYAEPRITQKLLDDANVDVEAWLAGKVADRFARVENAAFITGNGVGKPRGLTDYTTAATGDASRTWGQIEHVVSGAAADFAASTPADKLFDLVYKLKAAYRQGAAWLMPKATLADIRKFKDGNNLYLWQPSLQAGQPSMLLGYPVHEDEDMPAKAAGALGIAFGDFREGYQIVDRFGIRILRDPYTAKPYVKFYTTRRVGGAVVNYDAIKFLKFST